MDQPLPELTTGQRIQAYRKRQGLSQPALGSFVDRSADWVSKVERDVIPVNGFPMLLELARVLRVRDVADLTGRAIVALTLDESPAHESVPGIRRALHTQPSRLAATLPGEPLTTEQLSAQVGEAWRIYEQEKMRYASVGKLLPRLLAEANHTLQAATDQATPLAVRCLVEIYHLLQVYLRRVGERTLSQVAADRAMSMADQLGDPILIGASAWNLCSILTAAGHVEESADLARDTIEAYPLADDAPAEQVSVTGALHLAAVIASARSGRAPAAWDLLHSAKDVARRLDGDHNHWRTSFGATNVKMHAVHLAAEEGDAGEALRLADHVEDNEALPLERRTRYFIEVMHSHRLQSDDMGTLWMAQKIQSISPEEMRFHPLVRAAVNELVKRERPAYKAEVRDLAKHVGVLV